MLFSVTFICYVQPLLQTFSYGENTQTYSWFSTSWLMAIIQIYHIFHILNTSEQKASLKSKLVSAIIQKGKSIFQLCSLSLVGQLQQHPIPSPVNVTVSNWVLPRGRSYGSQQNSVQVRDALYGTSTYYGAISLSSCCTHTQQQLHREKRWASMVSFSKHTINYMLYFPWIHSLFCGYRTQYSYNPP